MDIKTMDNGTNSSGKINNSVMLSEKKKRLIFYIIMIAPMVLQVAIFYVYLNISNVMLAFTRHEEVIGGGYIEHFAGFENFKFVIDLFSKSENAQMIGVSFLNYLFIFFVATPTSVFFSYYIYKKFPMAQAYRVILFLPQIISAVVMTNLFRYIVDDIYFQLTGLPGLLKGGNALVALFTVIAYSLWMGFGANILLLSGAMSGINDSTVEASHLDGCNTIQEFIHITLPSIYPTLITFVIIDIAAIFTNQMQMYTFFDQQAVGGGYYISVGYYMYVQTLKGGLVPTSPWLSFSQVSAMGLMITIIIVPITLIVRKMMKKFGPSVD